MKNNSVVILSDFNQYSTLLINFTKIVRNKNFAIINEIGLSCRQTYGHINSVKLIGASHESRNILKMENSYNPGDVESFGQPADICVSIVLKLKLEDYSSLEIPVSHLIVA
jgi:hypothetical protein